MPKNIVVQGLGFVGAAMSTAIAISKSINDRYLYNVVGVDLATIEGMNRIKSINAGKFPFQTSDSELISKLEFAVKNNLLKATSSIEAYANADVVVVSINCDLIYNNNVPEVDLEGFSRGIKVIADNICEDTLVVIESTVPPGTTENIAYPIFKESFRKRKLDIKKIYISHSYERVMPGSNYLNSIINFWRVYSGIDKASADRCEEFISTIINTEEFPLVRVKNTTASETAKVLENSFRAVNIAFIEEWGRFSEDVGIDIYEILKAIRMRPTHSNIMQPGFGVGGYCLTKDPLFAKLAARDIFKLNGHDFPFSTEAKIINDAMPNVTVQLLKRHFNNSLTGKRVLLMGVSYRQDVGDTRYSPSEIFYKEMVHEGATVVANDPMLSYWDELEINIDQSIPIVNDFDAIVFAVPHELYRDIDMHKFINKSDILVFDANNVLTDIQINQLNEMNIVLSSIGRG